MNGPHNPIGWCDYTWNPVKGDCPMKCEYCYALRLNHRFKRNPVIRFEEKLLEEPAKVSEHSIIFVGSTIELYGHWIDKKWILKMLATALCNPQHTFISLTKVPIGMRGYDFPDNWWCGVSITAKRDLWKIREIEKNPHITRRLVSFEPLHSRLMADLNSYMSDRFDWIIVGAETGNRKGKIVPEEEWIEEIVEEARRWRIPIFLKDNIAPYWHGELIQEFPRSMRDGVW